MNSTRGSTPPNPNLDLPNRSTDLNKTLGIIGTPHEESIAKFNPTKTCPNKRNQRNPAKTFSNARTPKTPKSSPLTHGFGRGITSQRTTKGSHKFPPIKSPRARSRKHPKKTTKRGLRKSPPRTTGNNTTEALRNHAESSIHATKVPTRSSLPPDHPTLSQDLTMNLSS
jgi:hypothetical protein